VESIFGHDRWLDPTCVKCERGGLPLDPGTKAAGYYVRKFLSPSHTILALHRNAEPPNVAYYFGFNHRTYTFYDASLEETIAKYFEVRDDVDVVICDRAQIPYIEADGHFIERTVILVKGVPRMWIFARPDVEIPSLQIDVDEANARFDEEYSLYITLSPYRPGGTWRESK
jgi:hypothetical protein